jgi:hypothetical protein
MCKQRIPCVYRLICVSLWDAVGIKNIHLTRQQSARFSARDYFTQFGVHTILSH